MHRFYFQRLGLLDEAGEQSPAPSGDVKLTITQQIKAALAAKADLQAKIETLEGVVATHGTAIQAKDDEITALKADLATRDAKIAALEADAAAVSAALEAHKKEVAALKASEKTAEQKAKEKIAALGFPSAQLPAATDKPSAASDDEISRMYAAADKEPDPARKAALLKSADEAWAEAHPQN